MSRVLKMIDWPMTMMGGCGDVTIMKCFPVLSAFIDALENGIDTSIENWHRKKTSCQDYNKSNIEFLVKVFTKISFFFSKN